ncbi:hypothetical protein EEI45_03585 [Erysipelothrix piscisicarius]|uniref:Uncharacterized protein n=1 Tax=Erysipelothrix piscisicarius TaxID=2485784 RepID=A0A3Q8S7D9_9FIRM|nr:hypothetical protein [Erysipelothrix piscisicarius]AZK43976.1 hypothetical protein EEI45_03585 [Erysipelothrix piscisicarius]
MTKKMDPKQNKEVQVKKQTKKHDWSYYAIIICLVLILIPSLWLGFTIVKASIESGKPLTGQRFANDHDPEISSDLQKKVEAALKERSEFESVSVSLKTATLRIQLKMKPDTSKEDASALIESAYDHVVEILPVTEYFTTVGSKKQYDLEINLFNFTDVTEDNRGDFIYYQLVKNGNMEDKQIQLVSESKDSELVERLKTEQAEAKEKQSNENGEPSKEEKKEE